MDLRLFLIGTFPEGVIGGLGLNLMIACSAFITSFLLGHMLAVGRLSRLAPLRWACTGYIELVRSVPLLIVLFWFFFAVPILLKTPASPVWTALIALTAYGAAYQAEYIRSGIRSVAAGEIEAARSLGLSAANVWLQVILPQAHRRMLPTYASYFTSMFKDSSALYLVGLVDLMQTGLIAAERNPDRMLQSYLTVGGLFFIVCWLGTRAGKFLEWKFALRDPGSAGSSTHPPSPSPQPIKENKHAHA